MKRIVRRWYWGWYWRLVDAVARWVLPKTELELHYQDARKDTEAIHLLMHTQDVLTIHALDANIDLVRCRYGFRILVKGKEEE